MKVLIIYAHPHTSGFCPIILSRLKEELDDRHIEFEVLDLYRMNYNPVLREQEHYTSGHKKVSEENLAIQKQIKETDKLIFIFPIWWEGIPAILKGFFDRVFTRGFAFRFTEKGMARKLLKGKQALVLFTKGSPRIYDVLINRRASKNVQKYILGFCGIKSKAFGIYKASEINEKQVNQVYKILHKGLKYLLN